MLVLFETPAGYAIFKLLDAKKLKETDNLYNDFETPEAASKIIKLKHFEKFADTTEALAATTAAVEGKLSKSLKKVLKQVIGHDVQDQLLVADSKLGNAIKDKFSVQCVSNTAVQELMRCIRSQSDSLIAGLPKKEMTAMALGLAHSLSRYKLKFSPDKIDTMIIQAVSLLDDLDKELNNYIMRCREWYGWHFPELGKIITDNTAFVKVVKFLGTRDNAASSDLSDVLNEDLEEQVKEAAEISMGTEISVEDIINIQNLCDQVIEITNYRTQLYDYLKARMLAMAPNLSILVGDLVGARLISHAGSLINLAKHPASTVQILGAEKALFRALKAKKDTPKYGFIYHAQLIGQASSKNKGKMSRMLAAKASLAIRFDALGEDGTSYDLGAEHKAKLEARLRILEEGNIKRISGTGKAKAKFQKYQGVSEIKTYPAAADSTLKRKRSESSDPVTEGVQGETSVTPKQKKKKKSKEHTTEDEIQLTTEDIKVEIKTEVDVDIENVDIKEEGEPQSITPKQKKKKKSKEHTTGDEMQLTTEGIKVEIRTEDDDETQLTKKKKKKKGKQSADEMDASSSSALPVEHISKEPEEQPTTEKKKKKKKKHNE